METKHFSESEIKCSHCGQMPPDTDEVAQFWMTLDTLRDYCGFPLPVSSGYRCPEHPIEKAKKGGPGPHSTGMAADIAVSGAKAWKLLDQAFPLDFTGIGVSQRGVGRFIHLDMAPAKEGRPRPHVWSYA